MPRIAVLAVLAMLVLAGCGDEEAATSTTPTSVSSTTSAPTATTSDGAGQATEATNNGGPTARPQPGSGVGADNAVIAAAAVLTREGTPQRACGSFVTEAFIRTAYGGEANCIAARRPVALARSISVGPEDDENSTRIVVVPKGGPYDGVEVEVDLVEQDGNFRVDGLKADIPAGP